MSGETDAEANVVVDAPPQPDVVPPGSRTGRTIRRSRRRRRPSGAPPPLPHSLGLTGKGWLVSAAIGVAWVIAAYNSSIVRDATDRIDSVVLQWIARLRTGWLTSLARWVDMRGSGWAFTVVILGLIVGLVVFRRWRHLFTLLGSLLVARVICAIVYDGFERPRPFGVAIIGRWAGFSLPSSPVALAAFVMVGIVYSMVVPGHPRAIAKWVGVTVVAVYAGARLYLAVDHPSDVMLAIVVAVAVPLNAFRTFTPNEFFPVAYRKGKTAHLDVGGRRGEAIRGAIEDQLGVTVLDVKPVGLAGSGGSTPLRIRVAGDPDTYLFGKLYAMNHVRADRWYKLGRTILYGRLEDEAPFQSVRRLVQYEDYALRLFQDLGLPSAVPYGIVELTPEREYLLVTEFFDGAQEIGDSEVDDALIDQALALMRQLWDAGIAHRDIKPANLMVRDGRLLVIDVAFAQLRPSPWREAVDLANMMLVLAVRTDADRVYEHALRYFTPDDIAEAFAAARGIASPTQLRSMMKQDGRDLVARFRELAPERSPISLQRWSVKRILLAAALVLVAILVVENVSGMLGPTADIELSATPDCGVNNVMILEAQSVPRASSVPCIRSLPPGWSLGTLKVRRGITSFALDSEEAGDKTVVATLLPEGSCRLDGAVEVPSDELAMHRFERVDALDPEVQSVRSYVFDGGCITYRFSLGGEHRAELMFQAQNALGFQPRRELVAAVDDPYELVLCGAGAPRCEGEP